MDEQAFRNEFWPREVQKLWGVGPKLATRMRSLGISTVGDLAHAPDPVLKQAFGIIGPQLKDAAWGRDDTPLVPFYQGVDAKSMGHEVTLPEDCSDTGFLEGTLLRLSDQVSRRLRSEGYVSRVVSVKIRNLRFETFIRQRALGEFTDDHGLIYRVARGLLEENWKGEPLRLLGVCASGLAKSESAVQHSLFQRFERDACCRQAIDRIRDRLGEVSLVPAGSLTHRRDLSHVPFGTLSSRPLPDHRHADPSP